MQPEPKIAVETLRPHFSFTQLSTFMRCSLQYYFRYVLGWKGRPNLNLARGSAGHLTLEKNSRHKLTAKTDQPLEQMLDNFSDAWTKELSKFEPDDFEPGDNPDREKDHSIELIRTFRLDPHQAAAITPIAVELDFTAPLPVDEKFPDEMKPITGKIDQIGSRKRIVVPRARAVKRTEVIDYKWPSRKPSNVLDLAIMSDQLTMYDYVLTQAGSPTDDLGFVHFIPPTKTIPARIEATYRPPQNMIPARREARHQRLLFKLRQVMRDIVDGRFIPVDDPRVCANCEFRNRCQDSLVKDDYEAILIRGRHQ